MAAIASSVPDLNILAHRVAFAAALVLCSFSAAADEPCPAGTEPSAEGGCAPKIEINCPPGTIFEAEKGCVAKVVECPAGMIVEANKCVSVPKAAPPPPPPPQPKPSEPPNVQPTPEAAPKRLLVGVRVGFALPLLNMYRSPIDNSAVSLGGAVHGTLPIGLEVGYRVIDPLYVGALVSFGPAFVSSAADGYCSPSATTCSGEHLQVGLHARFYPRRSQTFDPWVGLGFGYERLSMRQEGMLVTGDRGGISQALSGFEFVDVSVGGDLALLRDVRVGPFASFALGQFDTATVTQTAGDNSSTTTGSIRNPTMHAWLVLGVRGALGIL